MKKLFVIILLSVVGLLDAAYLTYEHYSGQIPPCSVSAWADCGKVLRSDYAVLGGVPLAVIGVIHYGLFFCLAAWALLSNNRIVRYVLISQSLIGVLASLYFVYLQLVVIGALCLYCMVSALISTVLFCWTQYALSDSRKRLFLRVFSVFYRYIVKRILFLFDPEFVHESMVLFGERMSSIPGSRTLVSFFVTGRHPLLHQTICNIQFNTPVGLSAGFDYEARLTQSLSAWGFGFQSIGTITHQAYKGNPRPRLGRLPQSRSLMVNKGFKNPGAAQVIQKLEDLKFSIPVGVSIGRTNSQSPINQVESVHDIVAAFKEFESSLMKHSYYELNISCPNLYGDISFYPPENLHALLQAVDDLQVRLPIFVKMPIELPDESIRAMLSVIVQHKIKGIIIGNLQKNRNDPALLPDEVLKFPVGNFSGKPTFDRSNHLISLAYQEFGKKLIIIGCGGIFSASDAYKKIRLGASLVQLITGMVFEGPQLISEINYGLEDLLIRDGYSEIGEAVGVDVATYN